MAFDQKSVPKDLRPLNVARTLVEEPRIATATTTVRSPDGYFPNSARDIGSPESIPVFYPATVSEAGYVGLAYANAAPPGVAAWCPRAPAPVGHQGMCSAVGYGYNPNLGNRVAGVAADLIGSGITTGSGSNPNLGNRIGGSGVDHTSHDMASRFVYSNKVVGGAADQMGNDLLAGSGCSPNLGNRSGGSGVDQASDEGGDDSVSGKKVKFLCSFGGKIFPRPTDGVLRYVGGHTRIISVKRDVSFNELVQKMMDTYGQPVVIKYQLPDEDLDALVSVSCQDDLENMMDEYEKLVERSSDGSAKLRMFLFSASELDSSGIAQFGDLRDSGLRYVDALNGITDVIGSGGITRKESIASATSTQNSDFSGTEAVDSLGPGQGEVTGPLSSSTLSPKGNSDTSHDTSSRLVYVDPSHAVYAEASSVPYGTHGVKSGPPQTLSSQPEAELDRSVPTTLPQSQLGPQQPGMEIPTPSSFVQAYVDPRQEVVNHTDYIQLPPQMGFPNHQLLSTASPIFTQQQFRDNGAGISSHQFIPPVQMTFNPPYSRVGIRPNMVQPLMQPQQSQLDNFVDERTFGPRVVQVPVEQSYNSYHVQVPSPVVGGGYSWHQVPPQEHVIFSDGSVPHQQVVYPEKISRFEDCYMCQKALPHAHSDTVVQGQHSATSSVSDSNSPYHSLHLEDNLRSQPMTRVMVTGALGDGNLEQGLEARPRVLGHGDPQTGNLQPEASRLAQIPEAKHENERINLQQVDNIDHPRVSVPQGVIGRVADLQSSGGAFVGTASQFCQNDNVQQCPVPAQSQVKPDTLVNKNVTRDVPPVGGVPVQSSECVVHESPKEFSNRLAGVVPKDDMVDTCISYEQLRPIDGRMETLRISPTEVFVNKEHTKLPVDKFRMEDSSDHKVQQVLLDNTFNKFETNHLMPTEVLPSSSTEAPYMHNSRLVESYEVAQPPMWSNPGAYPQSKLGVHPMNSNEVHYGNPALTGFDSSHLNDRARPPAEWMDETLRFQSNMGPTNVEAFLSNVQDASNSLFSNQDPWNLHHDTQFPPPRQNRVPSRKDLFSNNDPSNENYLGNSGELNTMEDRVQQSGNSEHIRSAKGSAEEQIKQELQAVAEGVAASVFQPSTSSNLDLHDRDESANGSKQSGDAENSGTDIQQKDKVEDIKTKLPEKGNIGFPASDGIGRLQIIMNGDLEELRELGSGTFGTVYHGKWRGTDVAIKRINDRCFSGKASEQERMRDDFWNEAIKLADLHHPNVVAFYGVVLDGPGGSVATVTEYMVNGSLRNALQKNEKILDKRKRLLIAMDVAFGMEYLHGKNIVHFDLKSDNLLVNLRDPHRPICKVGDLGLSKVKCQTLISGGVRGTLPWMAPELLNGSSSLVSEKVDVFSFGIVLWELLTGEEPYADLHYGAIIGGIVSNTLRPAIPESCDLEWKSLMERCWSSEPSERPSFTEIANLLRAMASKIPPKGQNQQQQPTSTQPPHQI